MLTIAKSWNGLIVFAAGVLVGGGMLSALPRGGLFRRHRRIGVRVPQHLDELHQARRSISRHLGFGSVGCGSFGEAQSSGRAVTSRISGGGAPHG